MKKVYICGDSFGFSDPAYPGLSWTETLAKILPLDTKIINLSKVCASNLLINLQVNQAIAQKANYVIFMGTSVLRDEVKFNVANNSQKQLIDRFVDITSINNVEDHDLISYTMLNINDNFLSSSVDTLKSYSMMKDLSLLIYKDTCIIENALQKLVDSNIPFTFDQGGFENPKYVTPEAQYFEKFKKYFSKINLWDYSPSRKFRPYHHIVNEKDINYIAEYYCELINTELQINTITNDNISSLH
jgi:hypothetical protein